jgi:peptidoglycan/LPS O-acetylase OafA/YrhL
MNGRYQAKSLDFAQPCDAAEVESAQPVPSRLDRDQRRERSGSVNAGQTRTFLPYLEGVRGFFGLYVALAHMWLRVTELRPNLSSALPFFDHFVDFGHGSIAMFILISGYVLGLPVAQSGQTFRGGLRKFAKRRALRILPAYYAALAFSIPISLVTARLFDETMPGKTFVLSVGLHALMLHDLSNRVIDTIDSPMWSVAVECDIYVLFALLMVPMVRRMGFLPMVGASFALGLLPTLIGAVRQQGAYYPLSQGCFWYIGLFALGYAAANLSVDPRPQFQRMFERWPWQVIAIACGVLTLAIIAYSPPFETGHGTRWLQDVVLGIAVAAQFTADARARRNGRPTLFERFFLLRPLIFFGAFSYSLYLIHLPVLDLIALVIRPGWNDGQVAAWMSFGVVITVVAAYGFYRVFERPFLTSYRVRGDQRSMHDRSELEIPDSDSAAPARPAHTA